MRPTRLLLRCSFAFLVTAGLVLPLSGQEKLPSPQKLPALENPPADPVVPPLHEDADVQAYPIDLPTCLRLVNAGNPTIVAAEASVQAAYQRQRQAEVLWLPNLQLFPIAYTRQDGRVQRIEGSVVTTSRSNITNTGAVVLNFDSAEAYFQPLIRRQLTAAQVESARSVNLNLQLQVALAYLDLLDAYGRLAINDETLTNALVMLRDAESAGLAGKSKTAADVQRARTEVDVRRTERIDLEGLVAIRSAALVQLLYLQPTLDLRPADRQVLPIALVPAESTLDDLLLVAFSTRPELAGSRDQAAAALERLRQARVRPFVPQVQVGYLGGGLGGGRNDLITDYNTTSLGQAQLVWTLNNLGITDVARVRERRAEYTQATMDVLTVQAQVAAEVTAAARVARAHLRTLKTAQDGVRQGVEMWRRLREAAFGLSAGDQKYDPLEPLLAEQALAQARNLYLSEVINYNKAQFRLFTALGQPAIDSLPKAIPVPVDVPPVPDKPGVIKFR